jgi:hypothetical protein
VLTISLAIWQTFVKRELLPSLEGQLSKTDVVLFQFVDASPHRKYRALSLSQNLGGGAGQMCSQPEFTLHRTHSENDKVCGLIFRNFKNALGGKSELLAELK